ncbi:unnamed protein product [Aureobasidium vineae]|uniref:Uncharacterized protein n=1 Tax=Aureobasidium vineae TaxID=2773715 RepID=A0A9N8JWR0_9PEZI|nr:unnamed protein product [Aureobasidium vineae]
MGQKKKEVHDGKQTLKQAKAAFKARGSTFVTDTEKRQLERGAILLQRAERIKESEARRKEVLKKKSLQDTKATKTCLLGTQRVNDKFGYQRSQFHLGAFLKPKPALAPAPTPAPAPLSALQEEESGAEPWEDDGVDDDTLLDLAGESPVTTLKRPPTQVPSQQTPSKSHGEPKLISPSNTEEFSDWDDFLERSSQIARDLSIPQKPTSPATRSFDRIPSFTSADFDLSADDLEELDWSVDNLHQNNAPLPQVPPQQVSKNGDMRSWLNGKDKEKDEPGRDIDRKLMLPPMIPTKRPSPTSAAARMTVPPGAHGISLADLESLAGEEIQLSQFGDF